MNQHTSVIEHFRAMRLCQQPWQAILRDKWTDNWGMSPSVSAPVQMLTYCITEVQNLTRWSRKNKGITKDSSCGTCGCLVQILWLKSLEQLMDITVTVLRALPRLKTSDTHSYVCVFNFLSVCHHELYFPVTVDMMSGLEKALGLRLLSKCWINYLRKWLSE